MKFRSLAIPALLALSFTVVSAHRAPGVTVGEAAPNWTLPATTGKTHQLSEFKGKFVVMEWFNKDCPFVKKHYGSGNMQKLQAWAKEKGVVWLSVISSAPGKQGYIEASEGDAVMKERKMSSAALLLDSDGKVGKLYQAKTTPHIFIVDPKGKLVYNGAIDDTPSANPADIANAKPLVKLALEEALAGKPITTAVSQPYGCSVKY